MYTQEVSSAVDTATLMATPMVILTPLDTIIVIMFTKIPTMSILTPNLITAMVTATATTRSTEYDVI